MLRTETVKGTTFQLLKILMQDKKLEQFSLVGGTALALYLGHRNSIDLDLFTTEKFNANELEQYFKKTYNFKSTNPEIKPENLLFGYINDIKVDFVYIRDPLAYPVNIIENVRLFSLKDIAAMKLVAMSQNGTRLKDFVDIAYLSTKLSFNEMLDTFDIKFPKTNKISAIKGMVYFDDIDFSSNIELIEGQFDWKKIEKRLIEMVKNPDKKFLNNPITIKK